MKHDKELSVNYLAIGNGERCPFCGKYISENAKDVFDHAKKDHPEEYQKAVFGE